jgi:DNA modification methylase
MNTASPQIQNLIRETCQHFDWASTDFPSYFQNGLNSVFPIVWFGELCSNEPKVITFGSNPSDKEFLSKGSTPCSPLRFPKIPTTVIHEDKPLKNDIHPTMKPIRLVSRLIKNSSKAGENVIDFFGGSGSTLISCEHLGRKCYTIELDPKYVDVIVQRYINYKGNDDDVFLIRDGQRIPYKDVM